MRPTHLEGHPPACVCVECCNLRGGKDARDIKVPKAANSSQMLERRRTLGVLAVVVLLVLSAIFFSQYQTPDPNCIRIINNHPQKFHYDSPSVCRAEGGIPVP
jgi:hypothetical protein